MAFTDLAPNTGAASGSFASEFERAVQGLRGALTELLASVTADPAKPQVLARRFGINKNLAWKVSKIVLSTEGSEALPHIPGPGGLAILRNALAEGGASPDALERTREALARFHEMVERHAGNRGNLELMIASSAPIAARNASLETSRKLSFQGNSATFGVQAKVRFAAQMVAPNPADPELLDHASLGGFVDFRRLRETASWPLQFNVAFNDDESPRNNLSRPLDPASESPGELPFLREFCTTPLPDFRRVDLPRGTLYELGEGPVGNTAAFSTAMGWFEREMASIHRDEKNSHGEHHMPLSVPVETVQFDVFIHQGLPFQTPPELNIYSLMQLGGELPPAARRRFPLSHGEALQNLGSSPPVVASPHVPEYSRMIGAACQRLEWRIDEFRGFRFVLRYPPIPTLVVLRYPLVD